MKKDYLNPTLELVLFQDIIVTSTGGATGPAVIDPNSGSGNFGNED